MREQIYRRASFALTQASDQFQAMFPDSPAIFRIFVCDLAGGFERGALLFGQAFRGGNGFQLTFDGPGQIDRGWACRLQLGGGVSVKMNTNVSLSRIAVAISVTVPTSSITKRWRRKR